jgi:4-aminobutyrate aminotransferase-like enzyme
MRRSASRGRAPQSGHSSRAASRPAAAGALVNTMRERAVLIGSTDPAGNVLKIRPPLVFAREHADMLLTTLDEALPDR